MSENVHSVIINDIKYVPYIEVPELTDKRIIDCLGVLTEMRYFKQNHKMSALAWNAINALAPEIAKLSVEDAFDFIHPDEADVKNRL